MKFKELAEKFKLQESTKADLLQVLRRRRASVPEIAEAAKVSRVTAIAMASVLASHGTGAAVIQVFHHCSPTAILVRPTFQGMPQTPVYCPNCACNVDDLSYELAIDIHVPLTDS